MPNNTASMVYNYDTHRYEPTVSGCETKLNITENDLGGGAEAKVFLRKASDTVYRWLYSYVRKEAVRVIEYRIANNFSGVGYGMPYREGIEEALYAQIEYMLNFDGDMEALANNDRHKLVSIEAKDTLRMYGIASKGYYTQRILQSDYRNGY